MHLQSLNSDAQRHMKKSPLAVTLGVSGLVALLVTYLVTSWYVDQDTRIVFLISFFCTALLIWVGRMVRVRKN